MVEKHIHKLSRHKHKSGSIIYFCTMPDCNFKISPGLALGKRSICNRCGESFILSAYAIRLSKPHCEECHKPKQDNTIEEMQNIIAELPPTIIPLAERLKKVVNSHRLPEDEDEI